MKRFYSRSTGCCYLEGRHTDLPKDAVQIDDERYNSVIANPDPSKVRGHDKKGLPILVDPSPPGVEELGAAERKWRDKELAVVQWLRDRHRDEQDLSRDTTLTADQFGELLSYMQLLRDWPQSDAFPELEHRPVRAGWINELLT
ncbi:phage tail assembly chaperone [uncultured Pseudomonas sp.]|uniref:phage tail assembly chaperone n=1 Tax=uncultured Pseudomonas sp. TaxID=114707 RepID=UPI0025CCBBED|nr:phage tail assembly chaperone [uncultured Pseudomonas sp.]